MSDETPSALAPQGISPLSEADPASLNELIEERVNDIFNKPPLSISDTDLKYMVEYYRRTRLQFKTESDIKAAAGPKTPRGPKVKPAKSVAEVVDQFEL